MKNTTIKRIATSSLALVLLHGNSFARLAIGIHLAARTASAVAAQKTEPCVRRPMIATGGRAASKASPSRQFDAGENSFTTGQDWFRD